MCKIYNSSINDFLLVVSSIHGSTIGWWLVDGRLSYVLQNRFPHATMLPITFDNSFLSSRIVLPKSSFPRNSLFSSNISVFSNSSSRACARSVSKSTSTSTAADVVYIEIIANREFHDITVQSKLIRHNLICVSLNLLRLLLMRKTRIRTSFWKVVARADAISQTCHLWWYDGVRALFSTRNSIEFNSPRVLISYRFHDNHLPRFLIFWTSLYGMAHTLTTIHSVWISYDDVSLPCLHEKKFRRFDYLLRVHTTKSFNWWGFAHASEGWDSESNLLTLVHNYIHVFKSTFECM